MKDGKPKKSDSVDENELTEAQRILNRRNEDISRLIENLDSGNIEMAIRALRIYINSASAQRMEVYNNWQDSDEEDNWWTDRQTATEPFAIRGMYTTRSNGGVRVDRVSRLTPPAERVIFI